MIKEKFLFGTTFSFCNASGKFTFELLLSWYTYVGIWKPPTRRKRRTHCIYPELCTYAQTTVFIIIGVFAGNRFVALLCGRERSGVITRLT